MRILHFRPSDDQQSPHGAHETYSPAFVVSPLLCQIFRLPLATVGVNYELNADRYELVAKAGTNNSHPVWRASRPFAFLGRRTPELQLTRAAANVFRPAWVDNWHPRLECDGDIALTRGPNAGAEQGRRHTAANRPEGIQARISLRPPAPPSANSSAVRTSCGALGAAHCRAWPLMPPALTRHPSPAAPTPPAAPRRTGASSPSNASTDTTGRRSTLDSTGGSPPHGTSPPRRSAARRAHPCAASAASLSRASRSPPRARASRSSELSVPPMRCRQCCRKWSRG